MEVTCECQTIGRVSKEITIDHKSGDGPSARRQQQHHTGVFRCENVLDAAGNDINRLSYVSVCSEVREVI